jgi:hypothetical protein
MRTCCKGEETWARKPWARSTGGEECRENGLVSMVTTKASTAPDARTQGGRQHGPGSKRYTAYLECPEGKDDSASRTAPAAAEQWAIVPGRLSAAGKVHAHTPSKKAALGGASCQS